MRKPIAIVTVILAASLAPAAAHAQNAAAAEALFQKGHDLFEQKRYAEACPSFAESYRLDPVSGALLALASCHEAEGKLARAWAEYREVGSLARREGKNDRAEAATQRAAALAPKLAKLTIALAQGADAVAGLEVKRDGNVVGPPTYGTPLPVDKGDHVIEATAPGREPFKRSITILDGATELVPIPLLAETGKGAPPLAGAPASPSKEQAPFPLRTVGLVTAGLGAVVMGVGGYFGIQAISKNSESNSGTGACNGDVCTGTAATARKDAVSAGNTSTALFVVGGLLAAGGIVLFIVGAPSNQGEAKPAVAAAPAVGSDGAGVALTGRF